MKSPQEVPPRTLDEPNAKREQLITENQEFAGCLVSRFIAAHVPLDEYTIEDFRGIALAEMIRSVDRHLANPTIPLKAAISANVRQRLLEAAEQRRIRRRLRFTEKLRIAALELSSAKSLHPWPDDFIYRLPRLPELRPENKQQLLDLAIKYTPSLFQKANWLANVTSNQQGVMLMCYVLDLDLSIVARILGVTRSAVSQRHESALVSVTINCYGLEV